MNKKNNKKRKNRPSHRQKFRFPGYQRFKMNFRNEDSMFEVLSCHPEQREGSETST